MKAIRKFAELDSNCTKLWMAALLKITSVFLGLYRLEHNRGEARMRRLVVGIIPLPVFRSQRILIMNMLILAFVTGSLMEGKI